MGYDFQYAGFWRRLFADCIDCLIVLAFASLFVFAITFILPLAVGFILLFEILFLALIVSFLYSSLMQCSRLQATLGMMVLSIKTVDTQGNRISLGRACARELIDKFLWFVPLLHLSLFGFFFGFLLALVPIAFTPRKQGIHDMLTSCLVIRS